MIDSPKETAIRAFKETDDNATYEELMYRLYVISKISRGERDIAENRSVSNEEAKQRLGKWLK